jgi:hypothetical protein
MDGSRVVLGLQDASSQNLGAAAPASQQASKPQRGGAAAGGAAPKSKPDASNTRLRVSLMRLSRALAVEMPCWT